MDYDELVKEIKQQGITKLPALLIVMAKQCLKKNVFVKGGMILTIQKTIDRHERQPVVQANPEPEMPTDKEILKLQKEGHTFHCAMQILSGDGECECNKTDHIPGNLSRQFYFGRCPVCLRSNGRHKEWCRNLKKTTT